MSTNPLDKLKELGVRVFPMTFAPGLTTVPLQYDANETVFVVNAKMVRLDQDAVHVRNDREDPVYGAVVALRSDSPAASYAKQLLAVWLKFAKLG